MKTPKRDPFSGVTIIALLFALSFLWWISSALAQGVDAFASPLPTPVLPVEPSPTPVPELSPVAKRLTGCPPSLLTDRIAELDAIL
jgi:hypothetical protein